VDSQRDKQPREISEQEETSARAYARNNHNPTS
jgi:hypothetical protein